MSDYTAADLCEKCGVVLPCFAHPAPPDASLSRLLTLVEQIQEGNVHPEALDRVDVPSLRIAAQQHAEALRQFTELSEWDRIGAGGSLDLIDAATDFLDPKEEA